MSWNFRPVSAKTFGRGKRRHANLLKTVSYSSTAVLYRTGLDGAPRAAHGRAGRIVAASGSGRMSTTPEHFTFVGSGSGAARSMRAGGGRRRLAEGVHSAKDAAGVRPRSVPSSVADCLKGADEHARQRAESRPQSSHHHRHSKMGDILAGASDTHVSHFSFVSGIPNGKSSGGRRHDIWGPEGSADQRGRDLRRSPPGATANGRRPPPPAALVTQVGNALRFAEPPVAPAPRAAGASRSLGILPGMR